MTFLSTVSHASIYLQCYGWMPAVQIIYLVPLAMYNRLTLHVKVTGHTLNGFVARPLQTDYG